MNKFASILAMLMLGIGAIMAQENYKAVKGYVVDKNGNPIPGAEVMAPGGGGSAITDQDGSFSLNVPVNVKKLTASYDGMASETCRLKKDKDPIFILQKGRTYPGFINGVIGFQYNPATVNGGLQIGIMGGRLANWGFYGKATVEPLVTYEFSITGGVIKSISSQKIFVYAGIGYGMNSRSYDKILEVDEDGFIRSSTFGYDLKPAAACDLGFIFKTSRHFNISIGYNLIVNSVAVNGAQVGLGYVF